MTVKLPRKLGRDDLPPGSNLCDHCTAKCCQYYALPIETPTDLEDYEFIRWFIMHGESTIFTEGEQWYLMVHTRCRHLLDDNRCGIYFTRPQICRDYSTDNCEYEDDWVYERYFETSEQIDEFREAVLGPRPGASLRSAPPPLLPVIG